MLTNNLGPVIDRGSLRTPKADAQETLKLSGLFDKLKSNQLTSEAIENQVKVFIKDSLPSWAANIDVSTRGAQIDFQFQIGDQKFKGILDATGELRSAIAPNGEKVLAIRYGDQIVSSDLNPKTNKPFAVDNVDYFITSADSQRIRTLGRFMSKESTIIDGKKSYFGSIGYDEATQKDILAKTEEDLKVKCLVSMNITAGQTVMTEGSAALQSLRASYAGADRAWMRNFIKEFNF